MIEKPGIELCFVRKEASRDVPSKNETETRAHIHTCAHIYIRIYICVVPEDGVQTTIRDVSYFFQIKHC